MVRAKFVVVSIKHTIDGVMVELLPVTDGSEENDTFFKYTPSGKIEMSILPPIAAGWFIVGREYYVDFILAEDKI